MRTETPAFDAIKNIVNAYSKVLGLLEANSDIPDSLCNTIFNAQPQYSMHHMPRRENVGTINVPVWTLPDSECSEDVWPWTMIGDCIAAVPDNHTGTVIHYLHRETGMISTCSRALLELGIGVKYHVNNTSGRAYSFNFVRPEQNALYAVVKQLNEFYPNVIKAVRSQQ